MDVLDVFRRHDISLTNIGSRPSQKRNFEYYFFTDLLGHAEDEKVQTALDPPSLPATGGAGQLPASGGDALSSQSGR